MKKALVSVIVPIFMVEEYLDECIQSIVGQTYSNLEIILVNDGSLDGCPQKCDEWASKDHRIRVIHKPNGGLSSARNAGLDIAKGDYIAFVDSDDYITPDYVEVMYNRLCDDDSVGIVSGMIYRLKDGKRTDYDKEWVIKEERIISSNKIAISCIKESLNFFIWNKLFKSHLLENVRFREGRNNEDTLFWYDLNDYLVNTKYSMVEIPHYVYYYRYREGSICKSTNIPFDLDIIQNSIDMMADCEGKDSELWNVIYHRYTRRVYGFLEQLMLNDNWRRLYFKAYQKELRSIPFSYILSNFKVKEVIYIHLLKWMPGLRRMIRIVRESIRGLQVSACMNR